MKREVFPLTISNESLWTNVPPSFQVILTEPSEVTYIRMRAGNQTYSNVRESVFIDSDQPDQLIILSTRDLESISLRSACLKQGYDAVAAFSDASIDTTEVSPQQCFALEHCSVQHCLIFPQAVDGLVWYKALSYLRNKLNQAPDTRELVGICDVQPLPQTDSRWQEFDLTFVNDLGTIVDRLVVHHSSKNIPGTVKEFLLISGKQLCVADFQMLVSLLQSHRQTSKLLESHTLPSWMDFEPQTPLITENPVRENFRSAKEAGGFRKCQDEVIVQLAMHRYAKEPHSLKAIASAVQLQKLGIILESLTEKSASGSDSTSDRRLTFPASLSKAIDLTKSAPRNSTNRLTRRSSFLKNLNKGQVSLEVPTMPHTSRSQECRLF